jgi:hypothetical protein
MPLPVPSLDDTTFDDLVAEGHALIPRAFPAWTDHNESDPGVTLLELFAFLVESLIYRFDRIPDRTLVNLVRLVGVEPRPGQPTGDLLAVAAGTPTRPTAAVTAADVVALVRGGLLAIDPPLATDLPAGTPVEWLDPRVPATVTPARPTPGRPAGAAAGPPVEPAATATAGAAQPAAGAATGPAAGQAASPAPGRAVGASRPAGPPVGRLAAAVPAGATTVPVLPPPTGWPSPPAGWPEPPTGPIRLAGPDGPQDAVATAAVDRAEAVAADPAGGPGGSGLVRVVLVPAGAPAAAPVPAESLLQQAFELLRARTLLTTRVQAVGPVYRPVRIGVVVVRDPATLLRRDAVAAAVGSALAGYLSPVTGGAAGQGWEFGRPVFRSELYGLLEGVPGVDHVATLLLDGDASTQALPLHDDPALAALSLVRLAAPDVTVLDPGSAAAP